MATPTFVGVGPPIRNDYEQFPEILKVKSSDLPSGYLPGDILVLFSASEEFTARGSVYDMTRTTPGFDQIEQSTYGTTFGSGSRRYVLIAYRANSSLSFPAEIKFTAGPGNQGERRWAMLAAWRPGTGFGLTDSGSNTAPNTATTLAGPSNLKSTTLDSTAVGVGCHFGGTLGSFNANPDGFTAQHTEPQVLAEPDPPTVVHVGQVYDPLVLFPLSISVPQPSGWQSGDRVDLYVTSTYYSGTHNLDGTWSAPGFNLKRTERQNLGGTYIRIHYLSGNPTSWPVVVSTTATSAPPYSAMAVRVVVSRPHPDAPPVEYTVGGSVIAANASDAGRGGTTPPRALNLRTATLASGDWPGTLTSDPPPGVTSTFLPSPFAALSFPYHFGGFAVWHYANMGATNLTTFPGVDKPTGTGAILFTNRSVMEPLARGGELAIADLEAPTVSPPNIGFPSWTKSTMVGAVSMGLVFSAVEIARKGTRNLGLVRGARGVG